MNEHSADVEAALAFARDVYTGHGKIEILPKVGVSDFAGVAAAYTPGVGHVVRELVRNPASIHEQTAKDNLVAVISNGTAVLGLGDVGPHAGLPVMEGKAIMFRMLAGIDCMPLCVKADDPDRFVELVLALEPTFGAFNIEDVAAPGCFHIVERLRRELPLPVLHDDQFGTATVIVAGLLNALRLTERRPHEQRVVVAGCGAAGTACVRLLRELGVEDIVVVERDGILERDRTYDRAHWTDVASRTNPDRLRGGLGDAIRGRDVFIGLSTGGTVSPAMVRTMAKAPVVFALANPDPEISPPAARAAGAAVTASGRFDFPNHCNNVLAFPALFRAALDTRARDISIGMCMAAARAIAAAVPDESLGPDHILPSLFDASLYPDVAEAVARQAVAEGIARVEPDPGGVAAHTHRLRRQFVERQSSLPRHHRDAATGARLNAV